MTVKPKVEDEPLPGTRLTAPNSKGVAELPPVLLSKPARIILTTPVGAAPLAAVTVPVTTTGAEGEVAVTLAVPLVVVATPAAAVICN